MIGKVTKATVEKLPLNAVLWDTSLTVANADMSITARVPDQRTSAFCVDWTPRHLDP
jgi:hypothetical protein